VLPLASFHKSATARDVNLTRPLHEGLIVQKCAQSPKIQTPKSDQAQYLHHTCSPHKKQVCVFGATMMQCPLQKDPAPVCHPKAIKKGRPSQAWLHDKNTADF